MQKTSLIHLILLSLVLIVNKDDNDSKNLASKQVQERILIFPRGEKADISRYKLKAFELSGKVLK